MTSISKINKTIKIICTIVTFYFIGFGLAYAQMDSLTLSVTPTLFQMNVEPGQRWQSQVKVVNTNSFPITVYVEAVNLAPSGELGHSKFIPVINEVTQGTTLAEWINYESEIGYTILPQQSQMIPFIVSVPQEASPGGHYAALLVGTRPPERQTGQFVGTSQQVSSLFFLRVSGEVEEIGHIRSFSTESYFNQKPQADFELRFENRGNVHLQPQGQITIYNMWGKERGVIPINTKTHFGNVLPQSIRQFNFSWSGESSVTDIGRYKAEVALAYGFEEKKFETSEVYFWVVPLKPILITLSVIIGIILMTFYFVRAYVRNMLKLAGLNPDVKNLPLGRSKIIYEGDVTLVRRKDISLPIRKGWLDIKKCLIGRSGITEYYQAIKELVSSYRMLIFALIFIFVLVWLIIYFFGNVLVEQKSYEITIDNPTETTKLNSEQVILDNLVPNRNLSDLGGLDIKVINVSGKTGLAAEVAKRLLESDYRVIDVDNDDQRSQEKTVIVYPKDYPDEALDIRNQVGEALLSVNPDDTIEEVIIYVGKDLLTNTD